MNRDIRITNGRTTRVPAQSAPAKPHDLINLTGMIATLWRAKHIVIGCALAVGFLTAVALLRTTSVYTARAEVQLTREGTQVIDIANVIESRSLGPSDVLSEIAVISSPRILRRVAEKLDLSRYDEFGPQPGGMKAILSTIRRTLRGGSNTEQNGEATPASPNQIAAGYLADMISVRQSGLSYILLIDATSENPQRAAQIANAMAEEYLAQQVEDKLAATQRATSWLRDRVNDLVIQLEQAEGAVQERRITLARTGGASPAIISNQIADLSSLLVTARINLADAQERVRQFNRLIADGEFAAAAEIVQSPTLRGSGEQLQTLRRQITAVGDRVVDADVARRLEETRINVEKNLAGVAADISRGLTAAVDIASGKVRTIESAISELETELSAELGRTRELRADESRLSTLQGVYQAFLTRLTETRERGSFQEPNARINAYASAPDTPSAPRRAQLVALSFILAGAVAAAVVLALDLRRDGFKTARQAAEATGLPVLASLPQGGGATAETNEEIRRLNLALRGDGAGSGGRVLMICSALPGEKSADVARGLAAVAARDERTALLQADPLMRAAPKTVEGCDVLLIAELVEAAQAGGGSVRPSAILAALRERYDAVIVDAPPLLASTDTLSMAMEADAVVLAVRWSHTPRGAVDAALAQLGAFSAGAAGLVLTHMDKRSAAAFGYAGEAEARRMLARRWRMG